MLGKKDFRWKEVKQQFLPLMRSLILLLHNDVQEVIMGMAHRGRLNILANILGKTYEQIFSEFEGNTIPDQTMGSGDVKYHLGFSSEVETTGSKKVYLKLAPNPSHLEAVDPVVDWFCKSEGGCNVQSRL